MRAFGRSDKGRVRSSNQDAFVCGRLSDTMVYAVVCDGMGGARGGNVASTMAVKAIAERIVGGYRENMTTQSVRHVLECAVAAANVSVFDAAQADEQLKGMGTTVVAAVVCGQTAVVAHVGDSRAYLLNGTEMEQVTCDHSVVQELVASGRLTESEAKNHPDKNIITRAIGVEETVECDISEVEIPPDGVLLICTDGLTNMAESEEIFRIVRSTPPDAATDRLINAANMAGGSDNITAVVIA